MFSRRLSLAAAAVALSVGGGWVQAASAETITVLLPSFGADAATKAMTDDFTKATGIDVDLQTMPWDNIRPKIVTAMVAGTPPADVIEFDWSWVGQFGAAKWFTPLDANFDKALIADMPTASVFTYDGQLLGVPYANDFRLHNINKAYLDKAGITELPKTPDDIIKAARLLKEKKVVEYPISVPLSATEGAATAWYFMTRVFGGTLFDDEWKPLFVAEDSPGYKALQWVIDALHAGLINPAMTGMSDQQDTDAFAHGAAAIDLAGHPYDLAIFADKQRSTITGDATVALTGIDPAQLRTVGLPEALGVPANSEHKEAAVKFIQYWADHQPAIYQSMAVLPTRISALEKLSSEGKLSGGHEIARIGGYTQAIFPQGTPPWYSEFSSAVSATINQAAKGQITVKAAMQQIADRAAAAAQQ